VEVVVVDDGSTDESLNVIKQFGDHITVIATENRGAPAARNRGLEASTGTLVKFLDADDELYPDAIQGQVDECERLDSEGIVFGDGVWQFSDGASFQKDFRAWDDGEELILYLMRINPQTSLSLYPREVLQDVGGFDEELLRYQDLDLNLRIGLRGNEFRYCPRNITMIRMHEGDERISNQSLMAENPLNELKRLEKWSDLFESHGKNTPQASKEIAKRAWNSGRAALRANQIGPARNYFEFASDLCQDPIPQSAKAYKFTAKVLGPYVAEHIASMVRKVGLSKFIGPSMHPIYKHKQSTF
jgi:glycosyltransferase involved in cell wall biosynthesis